MKTHYSLLIVLLTAQLAHAVVVGTPDLNSKATPSDGTEEVTLGLNFRGAPLEQVLEYIADRAGLIIVYEASAKAKVDVWSNEKVSLTDGLALLNTVAAKSGLAALRNGRIITIVTSEVAKKREIPLITGAVPENIPKSQDLVTQIIPLKGIAAAQLVRDLSSLVPAGANFVANEGANSILMTDTQVHIRRMVEIVAALDTQVSSAASIRVFPMKFADSKAVAAVMKDLFQDTSTTGGAAGGRQNGQGGFGGAQGGFGGGGPGGGGPGGGLGGFSGGNNTPSQSSNVQATKLIALADEHSNSLIVKGSESQIAQVAKLLLSLDLNIKDTTELRVFHLVNADPTEMSEVLAGMFPDTSSQDNSRGGGFTFGGGGPGAGPTFASTTSGSSDRTLKQSKVTSIADARTKSLVVSASSQLMPQIAEVIGRLDSDARGKKKVQVFKLNQGSVLGVQTTLRELFSSQTASSTTATDALTTRQGQSIQNQSSTSSSSGIGGSGGGLGSSARGN